MNRATRSVSEITHLLPSSALRNALAPSKFALALSNVHNSMAPNPDFNDSPRLRSSNGPMSPESMQLTEDVTDEQLDRVVDRALRTGDVPRLIKAYKPDARWLWGRWRHTVLEQTWTPALVAMSVALAVHFTVKGGAAWLRVFAATGEIDLGPGDPEHTVVKQLKTLDTMWTYLLTMTTFVNSFFLSQAYGLWLATKVNSRKIQGRLNDVLMLLATHAARDGDGRYLPAAETLLADVARNVRTFHVFFWVGMTGKNTRQDRVKGMAPLALLRHDRGLKALRRRGALTERELETLLGPGGPSAKGRYHVVLEWIVTRCVDAKRRGLLVGGAGMETVLLDKCCLLRATCASIGDDMDARMPLACAAAQFCAIIPRTPARNSPSRPVRPRRYVHLVQILVDSLLVLAPLALYPRLGLLAAPLAGMATVFYRGFLELSKSFLDPFGNDDSLSENLQVDCLVTEINNGSERWTNGARKLPFDVVK